MVSPAQAALRCLTSAEIRQVSCPTCGAGRRRPCVCLRDRPMDCVHRGRSTKYLHLRFAVQPVPQARAVRAAPRLGGAGLHAVQGPHPQPWRLPLPEIGALVDASFLDLAKVATAEAAGLGPHALTGLLYGRDRIRAAIDALVFAEHDALLRQENMAASGLDARHEQAVEFAERVRQVNRRRQEAETELRRQRTIALDLGAPGAHDNTPIDDPQLLAAVWLARYLRPERDALLDRLARAAGIPAAAAAQVRTKGERVQRCVDRGLLIAPVTDAVQRLRSMDEDAFDRHVLHDAAVVNGRDDDLAHPLLVERWLQALNRVRPAAAAAALNPSQQTLTPLTGRQQPCTRRQWHELGARRALFAALVQRTGEAHRTRQAVQDAVTLAEHADPQSAALRRIGQQANAEIVRRHRDLYLLIRTHLEPHQTRYGRLLPLDTPTRRALKHRVWAALDASCQQSEGT